MTRAPRKKLLISSDCFLPRWDGIARFLAQIIPVLAQTYDVTVIAPKFPGKWTRAKGVKYVRFDLQPRQFGDIQFTRFNYHDVSDIVKQHDVVFNQTIGPLGMSAIRAAKKHRVPVLHYVHSIDWELASKGVKRFERFVYHGVRLLARSFYHKCNRLLVPSPTVDQILRENKIRVASTVVPMGIDTSVFAPSRSKSKSRSDVDIADRFTVGFVGRIAREKDLPTLFEAFKRFAQGKDVQLVIVGGGLTQIIPEHSRILATGPKGAVQRYLRAFDVFVMPSHTETSSLATIEAMSVGLAVCATPVGMIPQYVEHETNGLLFGQGDVNALHQHLERLFDDSKLRSTIGRNARSTIKSRFSKQVMAQKIIDAIESVSSAEKQP